MSKLTFDQIVANVKNITSLPDMMPVLCLTTEAVPIFISLLYLEDSSALDVQLPIIAASSYEKGRIMCFSQVKILHDEYFHRADTSQMISNSINWLTRESSENAPILLLGFDKPTITDINKSLQSLGITTESDDISNLSKYNCIFIPSNITPDIMYKLTDYVKNGGGLAVFNNNPKIEPINKFLLQFGLSYTYCVLNEGFDNSDDIQAPPAYAYVKESHFVPLLNRFKLIMNKYETSASEMDDLIVTLRYYIVICDESYFDEFVEIAKYAWIYLKRTDYSTKEGICSDLKQGIVSVILQDIYEKIPVDKLPKIPEASFFPGETGSSVEFEKFELDLDLDLVGDNWISTGLWISSSKSGTVSGDSNSIDNVMVQIGSHSDSLLHKKGPWKRWPKLVSLFKLKNSSVVVGSPFGGIVYVTLNNDDQICENKNVRFVFDGFSMYPRAVVSDPSIWEETKDIDVPWGELDIGEIIFTLPSPKLREIPDFVKIKNVYDVILSGISDFMSWKFDKKQRIIFDIETLEGEIGYPIFLNINQIDNALFEIDHPTVGLFNAVYALAIISIRLDIFNNQIEAALATVAAAEIMKKLFHDFDPMNFEGIRLPVLFCELWDIQCNFSNNLISLTLSKFQSGDYPVSDDTWIDFVKEMCILGERDFTKLFENSGPIPLSKSSSFTQGLKIYRPLNK